MLYAMLVAALLSVAALGLERVATVLGRPRRWVWVAAISASIILPLVTLFGLNVAGGQTTILPVGAGRVVRGALQPLVASGTPTGGTSITNLNVLLVGTWFAASAVLLLGLFRSHRELSAARSGWGSATPSVLGLSGVELPLRLSDDFGPAVIGWRRSEIVLPRWLLDIPPVERSLVLLHESEHLRAGDVRLYLAGRLATVCVPWLLPLWWQLHRLRLAVEIDCDARVLRRGVDSSRYGRLLLEVGRRRSPTPLSAALAEPVSHLERRIRAMIETSPRYRWLHAGVAASVALVFVVLACESPTPQAGDSAVATEPDATVENANSTPRADAETGVDADPAYIARDEEPKLLNAPDLHRAMQDAYEPFREAGDDYTVSMYMFVDADGRVSRAVVQRSSGRAEVDEAAIAVTLKGRWEPARSDGEPIGVWVVLPLEFRTN